MKFTLSWLKDHLDTEAPLSDILDALNDLGLEVEEVIDPAKALSAFTLGKVLEAEQHPDADRLRVCKVATIEGEKQIICGAPNARAGITAVIALPGTYIPGIDTTIQIGKIRGVESYGMMCSEREMLLSDEHDGIIELASGEVGMRFVDWLEANDPAKVDPVIDIAITPNRPDALGVRGIARDLAARGLGKMKPLQEPSFSPAFPCPIKVEIAPDALQEAPHFTGALIRGVRNGPSPQWLQDRLRAIGLRPISALVDITNFFTFDQNRPLHVFDADKLGGDSLHIHKAVGNEKIIALDDKEYALERGQIIISASERPESIAGVMGGAASGVNEETTNVFLESAWWDPVRIALTGRALKINSDARYRFERGIDPDFTRPGLEHAISMILELCGGEASEIVEAGAAPDHRRSYTFNPEKTRSLLGFDIEETRQKEILEALGFKIEENNAHPPSWRPDILGEADLVEEIGRVASLTQLVSKPLPKLGDHIPQPVLSLEQKRAARARRETARLGYLEIISYSFIDEVAAEAFGGKELERKLANPISSDMVYMRPSLLPGLLRASSRNQARGFSDFALFETGKAFLGGEPGEDRFELSGIRIGMSGPRDPHGLRRAIDLFDLRADLQELLDALNAPARRTLRRGASSWFHPGRSGVIGLGPKMIMAEFGELHPGITKLFEIKGPAFAFSLFPNAIPTPKKITSTREALHLAPLQTVERDFAFIVDQEVAAEDVERAALAADKAAITGAMIFDVFEGAKAEAQFGEGKKSLALSVSLQPVEKSFTDKELEMISEKIIAKVAKATGGVLRG